MMTTATTHSDKFYLQQICSKLDSGAKWRSSTSAIYQTDRRNAKAASDLRRFAESNFDEVSERAWNELRPFLETVHFSAALESAVRDVAFRSHPATLEGFIWSVTDRARAFALSDMPVAS